MSTHLHGAHLNSFPRAVSWMATDQSLYAAVMASKESTLSLITPLGLLAARALNLSASWDGVSARTWGASVRRRREEILLSPSIVAVRQVKTTKTGVIEVTVVVERRGEYLRLLLAAVQK